MKTLNIRNQSELDFYSLLIFAGLNRKTAAEFFQVSKKTIYNLVQCPPSARRRSEVLSTSACRL